MSTPIVQSQSSSADQRRLCCTFQASSLRQAAGLEAELRATRPDVTRVRPAPPRQPGRRDWIVTLTTAPVPLTLDVLEPWEGAMLDLEHRWPGCRFLGWTTQRTPATSIRPKAGPRQDAAGARWRQAQRELVIASLLRCPSSERRGVVHGRSVPR